MLRPCFAMRLVLPRRASGLPVALPRVVVLPLAWVLLSVVLLAAFGAVAPGFAVLSLCPRGVAFVLGSLVVCAEACSGSARRPRAAAAARILCIVLLRSRCGDRSKRCSSNRSCKCGPIIFFMNEY